MKFVVFCMFVGVPCIFSAWTDELVKKELSGNLAAIKAIQTEMAKGERSAFPLSLAMAKWASRKARSTSDAKVQRKYASLARDILNEAKGFGWQNRAPTSTEGACMASTSVDVALATNDSVDTLWDGLPRAGGKSNAMHYVDLKRAAVAGRYIGAKAPQLTFAGVITWARMSGIRNFLVDPIQLERPKNIVRFFTPNATLETIDVAGNDWKAIGLPDTWEITDSTKERLLIADNVIRKQNRTWPVRGGVATLAHVRDTYNELKRLGTAVSADLQSPSDEDSTQVALGYSPLIITKLIPLFSLLDPKNFLADEGFDIGSIRIESATAQWLAKSSSPDFAGDFAATSALLDQMEFIIKTSGFGGQGVHELDAFQIANTKKMLALGRKYFAGHYVVNRTKRELTISIDARLTTLGADLTAYYDGGNLTRIQIMTHLGYVLNGYLTGFTTALASQSDRDKVTETDWLEILSMIFYFSQKLDMFRLNTGIDTTPYNLESTFYSQLWENQYTGGGCVPGRKNRILYRLANLLRQWMAFGYSLA